MVDSVAVTTPLLLTVALVTALQATGSARLVAQTRENAEAVTDQERITFALTAMAASAGSGSAAPAGADQALWPSGFPAETS